MFNGRYYYFIVYKITNLINGYIYIGVHRTHNIEDSYYGSGRYLRNAINKYGKLNFVKNVLYIYYSKDVAYKREKYLVNEEFISRIDTYNNKLGGYGGWDHCHNNHTWSKSKDTRQIRYGSYAGYLNNIDVKTKQHETNLLKYGCKYGKLLSDESKDIRLKSNVLKYGGNNPWFNSRESIDKRGSTRIKNTFLKYPELLWECELIDPYGESIFVDSLYGISKLIYGNEGVISKHKCLVNKINKGTSFTGSSPKWRGYSLNRLNNINYIY